MTAIDGFEIPVWFICWFLAMLGGPTLLPIIAGVVCGNRMEWIPPRFGFVVGIGTGIVGSGSYIVFTLMGIEHVFPDSELTAAQAFGSLAVAIIVQVLVVMGVCRLVNFRRSRSWGIRGW